MVQPVWGNQGITDPAIVSMGTVQHEGVANYHSLFFPPFFFSPKLLMAQCKEDASSCIPPTSFFQKHLWLADCHILFFALSSSLFPLFSPLYGIMWARGSFAAIFNLFFFLQFMALHKEAAIFFQLPLCQTLLQIFHCYTNDNCNRNNNESNNKTMQIQILVSHLFFFFLLTAVTNKLFN